MLNTVAPLAVAEEAVATPARPATAGGFDGRPPREPRTGQVIPFPVERVRQK